MIPLHTRADDFGASPGTNDAILACLEAGFVRNVGVMAPAPWLHHRREELLAWQDRVSIGLHATVTSEWSPVRWGPLLPPDAVPGLVEPDGTFHRSTQQISESGTVDEILREVAAQLAHVRQLGLRPRYLDTHMVFTWIAGVSDALARFCGEEGLRFVSDKTFASLGIPLTPDLDPNALAAHIEARHAEVLPKALQWVFHPAQRDAISEQFYSQSPSTRVADARHQEFLALSDPALLRQLETHAHLSPAAY